jgi:hypothetical protein
MKRRFVKAILASVAAATVAVAGAAQAQEIPITGPLKGAPAVRHLRLYREGRVEIAPSVSFTLLDEYRRTIIAGAKLNYNIKDWIAIGVWAGVGAISTTTDLTDKIDATAPRDALTAINVNHSQSPQGGNASFADQTAKISWVAVPQLTFIPFRGKLAIFNQIFVDTDFYISAGPSFIGIQERGNCGPSQSIKNCNDPKSFALTSVTKTLATGSVGFTFYPGNFWSLGVEYRLLPFSWNRAGFDTAGGGSNSKFPDQQIDGKDESLRFNQLVTISLGFYLPTKPRLSD